MKPVEIVRKEDDSFSSQYPIVRYYEIRCEKCKRMLYCHNWESVGYPWTYCESCENAHYWPFDERKELKEKYDTLYKR